MNRIALLLALPSLGLLALACTPTPEAPTEFSDLVRYMLREWENEDPRYLEEGAANLDAFLADVDLLGERDDRSWIPDFLEEEDVAALEWPTDRSLDESIPVAIARESSWPVEDHARLQMEEDQTITEPTSPSYIRTISNLDDPSCYWERSCDVAMTSSDVARENLAMSIEFILLKDFRWVRVGTPEDEDDEDIRWAVVARSWCAESFHGEQENTHIWQTFALEAWIGQADGTTWRMQSLWAETDLGDGVTDDQIRGTTRWGVDGVFVAADDAIQELYHPE